MEDNANGYEEKKKRLHDMIMDHLEKDHYLRERVNEIKRIIKGLHESKHISSFSED
jgi:hypothetical protein